MGTAIAKKTIILNNSYKQGCVTDVGKQHEGKGMVGLPTHGFHPEDDEMGTLQVPGEQFSLFYAL